MASGPAEPTLPGSRRVTAIRSPFRDVPVSV
jgi:hypothetical protein